MVNLCPSRSQPLMEKPEFSRTLFQKVGVLAKLSPAQFSSKLHTKLNGRGVLFILMEQPATPLSSGFY